MCIRDRPLAGYKRSFVQFGTGSFMGISYLIIVALLVMIFVFVLLNMTTLGKNIYAIGGNREAAKVAGINAFKIDMFVYMLSGALAAFAGCMLAVSYTHLDVYKRQSWIILPVARMFRRRSPPS